MDGQKIKIKPCFLHLWTLYLCCVSTECCSSCKRQLVLIFNNHRFLESREAPMAFCEFTANCCRFRKCNIDTPRGSVHSFRNPQGQRWKQLRAACWTDNMGPAWYMTTFWFHEDKEEQKFRSGACETCMCLCQWPGQRSKVISLVFEVKPYIFLPEAALVPAGLLWDGSEEDRGMYRKMTHVSILGTPFRPLEGVLIMLS